MTSRIIALCVLLLSASAFLARAVKTEPVPIRAPLKQFPMTIGDWQGNDLPEMDAKVREVLGVDDYLDRIYIRGNQAMVGLYVGYYQSQRRGDTMHSPLNCLPGAGWNPMKRGYLPIEVQSDSDNLNRTIEVNRIIIQKGMGKQLVLYWYQSIGRVVASEYWGKIYTVLDAMRTNRTDAALVRVICPIAGMDAPAEENSEMAAVDFIRGVFPLLDRHLPK
jgi:EpsI family protein